MADVTRIIIISAREGRYIVQLREEICIEEDGGLKIAGMHLRGNPVIALRNGCQSILLHSSMYNLHCIGDVIRVVPYTEEQGDEEKRNKV